MPSYARLRSDLVVSSAKVAGETVYNIKDPYTDSYFRLREPEYWLIRQLDGETSPEEIATRFREKFAMNITPDAVETFIDRLEELYFLDNIRAEQATTRASYQVARGKSLFSRLLFIKLKAFAPGRLLDFVTRLYRPFHTRFWFAVEWLVIILGVWVLAANWRSIYFAPIEIFSIGSIAAIFLSISIIVSLHEFAHAVVCRYYGGRVKEMGFLLLYFDPCFYTDVSDAWLFPRKSQRLAVTWAGPFFQFFYTALAVFIWRITVTGTFVNDVARIVAAVSWLIVLFNFNPLIKLDGYYLLSDWVDIPNLRRKSFSYLGNFFKRRLLGWVIEPVEASPREKRIYLAYALLAVAYSGFLIVYLLVIVAGYLVAALGGTGVLLLAVVLMFTFRAGVAALGQGVVEHVRQMKHLLKHPTRLAVQVLIALVVVVVVFAVPFPHRVSGEVSVRPIEEFTLLLNEFGLLERVHRRGGASPETRSSYLQMTTTEMAALDLVPLVSDGQTVAVGDTLAVLQSNQVTREFVANRALLDKYESQLELLRSPPKREEVNEAEADVAAARATYDKAMKDLSRMRELCDKGLASEDQLEQARSDSAVTAAELANKESRLELLKSPPKPEEEAVLIAGIEEQRARLKFLQEQQDAQWITAPIAGTVTTYRTSDRILSVVANSQIELLVPVSDFDIDLVRDDQPVTVRVRTYPARTFEGTVVYIPRGASLEQDDRRFLVSVLLDNEDDLLRQGMTGYAKIEVGSSSLFRIVWRRLLSILRVEFWSWW